MTIRRWRGEKTKVLQRQKTKKNADKTPQSAQGSERKRERKKKKNARNEVDLLMAGEKRGEATGTRTYAIENDDKREDRRTQPSD